MTAPNREQREQIRRDATEVVPCYDGYAPKFQAHCLDLLDTLEQAEQRRDEAIATAARAMERVFAAEARAEQAERERDETRDTLKEFQSLSIRDGRNIAQLEARIAAVPALVEALDAAVDYLENHWAPSGTQAQRDRAARLRAALTAYHQASE